METVICLFSLINKEGLIYNSTIQMSEQVKHNSYIISSVNFEIEKISMLKVDNPVDIPK